MWVHAKKRLLKFTGRVRAPVHDAHGTHPGSKVLTLLLRGDEERVYTNFCRAQKKFDKF